MTNITTYKFRQRSELKKHLKLYLDKIFIIKLEFKKFCKEDFLWNTVNKDKKQNQKRKKQNQRRKKQDQKRKKQNQRGGKKQDLRRKVIRGI